MQGSTDAEPALQERPLVVADNEKISDAAAIPGRDDGDGWWRQCLFVRNGRRVPANWRGATARWPTAAALFERLLGARRDDASEGGGLGVADSLPKGSIEFSMLAPRAHLKAHCGPSNHRLRIHLPIVLPSAGENERARMQVGEGKPRAWQLAPPQHTRSTRRLTPPPCSSAPPWCQVASACPPGPRR